MLYVHVYVKLYVKIAKLIGIPVTFETISRSELGKNGGSLRQLSDFHMTLKNGFSKCMLFVLTVNG